MGASGGENAKFGLTTAEILAAAKILADAGHGAVPSSSCISTSARRCPTSSRSRTPCARPRASTRSSRKMGIPIELPRRRRRPRRGLRRLALDLRQLDELLARGIRARHRLQHRATSATTEKVPHPNIVSESGRAIVAHHSRARRRGVRRDREDARRGEPSTQREASTRSSTSSSDIRENLAEAQPHSSRCHDALQSEGGGADDVRRSACSTSTTRRSIETLFWRDRASGSRSASQGSTRRRPRGAPRPRDALGDQYLCNFSVFQSLLDHWALGAALPDHADPPAQRDARRATRTLVDITCDSDGKVSKFIDLQDVTRHAAAPRASATGALLPRLLPDGRLPGHHGRPAQPLRPRERGARLPRCRRGERLLHRGDHRGQHASPTCSG